MKPCDERKRYSIFKKITSMMMALILCLTLCIPSFACEDLEPCDEETKFVSMTRDEYIALKADVQNVSYAEAEKELDAKIEDALSAIPMPQSWEVDKTVTNGDSTYTSYGRIYKTYRHASGLEVEYSVAAVKLRSYQGSQWIELTSGSGWCQPKGNGRHNFYGTVSAYQISKTEILMSVTGYIEIAESVAKSQGISSNYFQKTTVIENTQYYRADVRDSHTEKA